MTREERARLISEWMVERYPDRYELQDGRAQPTKEYLDEIRNKIEKVKTEETEAPKAKAAKGEDTS
jgi:predicted DNA-binding protein (UPF0278 family)